MCEFTCVFNSIPLIHLSVFMPVKAEVLSGSDPESLEDRLLAQNYGKQGHIWFVISLTTGNGAMEIIRTAD